MPAPTIIIIGNALTTLFFKDLENKFKSLGLAFNMCCEDTKLLWNVKIKEIRLNYTQRYASFGTGSRKQNASTTNARTYYVSTY